MFVELRMVRNVEHEEWILFHERSQPMKRNTRFLTAASMVLAATAAIATCRDAVAQSYASRLTVDPTVKAAEESRSVATMRAEELEQSTRELLRLIQEMDDTLSSQELAWEHLKKQMALLKQIGEGLRQQKNEFARDFELYESALEKAIAAFTELSALYQQFAQDEDEDFFKASYLDLADISTKFSELMTKRHEGLAALNSEMSTRLKFVDRSLLWLDRFDQFATAYDPTIDKGAEVERMLEELNQYISYFEESIKAFGDFSNRVLKTTSDAPRPDSQEQTPVARAKAAGKQGKRNRSAGLTNAPASLSDVELDQWVRLSK